MGINFVYHKQDGVTRRMLADEAEPDRFTVYTEVDMEAAVDNIKTARELQNPRSVNKHLARVPMTVVEKSIHEQWDDADWKRWLNDPDNAAFRVWQGRV